MLCFQEWLTEKFTDDVREYDLDLHVEQAYSEEEVCDMYDKYIEDWLKGYACYHEGEESVEERV